MTVHSSRRQTLIASACLAAAGVLLLTVRIDMWGFDLRTIGATTVMLAIVIAISAFKKTPPVDHAWAKQSRFSVFLAAATALVLAPLFLFIVPKDFERLFGIDGAVFGFIFLVGGTIQAIWGLLMPAIESGAVSVGEKRAVTSLSATAIIAAYFVYKFNGIGWDFAAPTRVLSQIAINGILLAVFAQMCRWIADSAHKVISAETENAIEDERDYGIRRRSVEFAYGAMIVFLAAFIVSIGLPTAQRLPLKSPIAIAHALIGIVMLCEIARHAVQIWLYRRDRV